MAEAIIAFVVFTLGITLVGMVMGSSIRNMQNAKNRIIAINIAREGVEAMRNIRDTNWLKFQSRRRDCWNYNPSNDPNIRCVDSTNAIQPGEYTIYKQGIPTAGIVTNPTYRWRLQKKAWSTLTPEDPKSTCDAIDEGDLYLNNQDFFTYRCIEDTNNLEEYLWVNTALLSVVDIDSDTDTDLDNDKTNDQDIYNHIYTEADDQLGTMVDKTPFTRIVRIEYIDNDGTIQTSGTNVNWNRIRVTSTVSWQSVQNTFSVELVTHLTDYLGREKISG